eukprot:GHVN01000568.1.p2 GENE.GHVN01000568.1~~GHVN01000568.1.p2  ORF type:complete len:794 (+),score=165.11 GHVN01000568.1:169-2550(+)
MEIEVVTQIILSHFGEAPSITAAALMKRGALQLIELLDITNLPFAVVRNSLLVLMQHNIVCCFTQSLNLPQALQSTGVTPPDQSPSSTQSIASPPPQKGVVGSASTVVIPHQLVIYSIDTDSSRMRLRLPMFIDLIEIRRGRIARVIACHVARFGRATLKEAVDAAEDEINAGLFIHEVEHGIEVDSTGPPSRQSDQGQGGGLSEDLINVAQVGLPLKFKYSRDQLEKEFVELVALNFLKKCEPIQPNFVEEHEASSPVRNEIPSIPFDVDATEDPSPQSRATRILPSITESKTGSGGLFESDEDDDDGEEKALELPPPRRVATKSGSKSKAKAKSRAADGTGTTPTRGRAKATARGKRSASAMGANQTVGILEAGNNFTLEDLGLTNMDSDTLPSTQVGRKFGRRTSEPGGKRGRGGRGGEAGEDDLTGGERVSKMRGLGGLGGSRTSDRGDGTLVKEIRESGAPFCLNMRHLNGEAAKKIVEKTIAMRVGEKVPLVKYVMKVLLCGVSFQPTRVESRPMTLDDIQIELRELLSGRWIEGSLLIRVLDSTTKSSDQVVRHSTRGDVSTWSIDWESARNLLQRRVIYNAVATRCGEKGARLWALLSSSSSHGWASSGAASAASTSQNVQKTVMMLMSGGGGGEGGNNNAASVGVMRGNGRLWDDQQLAEAALMSAQCNRQTLYNLVQVGYARSHQSDMVGINIGGTAGKHGLLFSSTVEATRVKVFTELCKTAANLMIRKRFDGEVLKRTHGRARLLSPTEDDTMSMRSQVAEDIIDISIIRLDETLMVLQDI